MNENFKKISNNDNKRIEQYIIYYYLVVYFLFVWMRGSVVLR